MSLKVRIGSSRFEIPFSSCDSKVLGEKFGGWQRAKNTTFWHDHVLDLRTVGSSVVLRSTHLRAVDGSLKSDHKTVTRWLEECLRESFRYPKCRLADLLPPAEQELIPAELMAHVERRLAGIYTHLTGCHGDLHYGNMLINGSNQIRLIDLDCFQPNGTFEFDIFHFYVDAVSRLEKESWLRITTEPRYRGKVGSLLRDINHHFADDFPLFYTVVRAHLEMKTQGRTDRKDAYSRAIRVLLEKQQEFNP